MKKRKERGGVETVGPVPPKHQKPLPWEHPKSKKEDPDAHRRIKAIMSHKNYIQADKDSNFLLRDEMSAVRLELDYLKPELLLKENGVKHTIVVFGSTRIIEESEARRKYEALKKKYSTKESKKRKKELRIAKRILAKSPYYEMAREFGQIVGRSGKGPGDARVTLMTGGGPGIMEAANRGAFDVGAKSIGLNITLPHEQFPNPYITPELCFQFHYFAIRKLHFMRRAKALVIFPGGYGTFDETFEVLTLVQTRKIKPLPVIFIGKSYWKSIVNFNKLMEEGVIDAEDRKLFYFAKNAQEAWDMILSWHIENGKPLIKHGLGS
jgi:uncharacterized protein (TIGR00730 family)